MPNPARRTGVSPTLGLTTEPLKGLIGECCIVVVRQGERSHAREIELLLPVRWSLRDRGWPRIRA